MLRFLKGNRGARISLEHQAPRRRVDLGGADPAYAIYAIGDVHGCLDLLLRAEERILADAASGGFAALIVLLGDYIDRGPSSSAVLDHLTKPLTGNVKRISLCGNHEDLLSRFIVNPDANGAWLELGGRETLMSYGIDFNMPLTSLATRLGEVMPAHHRSFLEELPVYARIGNYLFVHAGVRPGVPLDQQTDEDMLWIREPFISTGPQISFLVIHGHTPSKMPTTGPKRIGIDTGAYATGNLSILKMVPGSAPSFLA